MACDSKSNTIIIWNVISMNLNIGFCILFPLMFTSKYYIIQWTSMNRKWSCKWIICKQITEHTCWSVAMQLTYHIKFCPCDNSNLTGLKNYHKIAIPDCVHVPNFWRVWHTKNNNVSIYKMISWYLQFFNLEFF